MEEKFLRIGEYENLETCSPLSLKIEQKFLESPKKCKKFFWNGRENLGIRENNMRNLEESFYHPRI
jgi:hypothetical protein